MLLLDTPCCSCSIRLAAAAWHAFLTNDIEQFGRCSCNILPLPHCNYITISRDCTCNYQVCNSDMNPYRTSPQIPPKSDLYLWALCISFFPHKRLFTYKPRGSRLNNSETLQRGRPTHDCSQYFVGIPFPSLFTKTCWRPSTDWRLFKQPPVCVHDYSRGLIRRNTTYKKRLVSRNIVCSWEICMVK